MNERSDASLSSDELADPLRVPRSRRFDAVSVSAFRSFISVIEKGGFSAAARQLGLSVSTITKHVELLEARLHSTLMLRSTRHVMATDAGRRLYDQLRTVLDTLDGIVEQKFAPSGLHGRLRVVAPPSFTSRVLSPALPSFQKLHPQLQIELRVTTAGVDFLREGIDLAIRMNATQMAGDRIEKIGAASSVLCASPAYLDRFGEPLSPDDLMSHSCLGGISSPYGEIWPFNVDGEMVEYPVNCSLVCDTGDVLRDACLQDLGIGGFYKFHVGSDIAAGRLVPVLSEFQADVSSLYVLQPSLRYDSPNVVGFIAFLKELWRENDENNPPGLTPD